MTRRSKEQRRTDYLDIGAQIVAESRVGDGSDPGLAVAHVKLADVAQRAKVTKGALYHIWPSQESFWHDLLIHLIETNQLFGAERLAAIGDDLALAVASVPTLREFANALFDSLSTEPTYFARISLFSYLDDDGIRKELDRSFRDSTQTITPMLERGIANMGLRLVDGATTADLAIAIAALLDGLCLQHRVDPELTPDVPMSESDRCTLFAASTEALLRGYTEPLAPEGALR